MRQQLETWLLDNWYATDSPPSLILRLLEPLYRLIATLRVRLLRAGNLHRPVIVVGNLTAGGSGKTPLVIALCQMLSENGISAGVISRGYGRRGTEAHKLTENDDAATVGDEPLLIYHRTGVPVAVAARRIDAADLLASDDLDVLIADDGLQHYQLPRAIEICVIDGERRFGNGHLLPAGPLREPLNRLAEMDFCVCNGGRAKNGEQQMRLHGDLLHSLDGNQQVPLVEWRGREVDAIAGIGHPQRFFGLLYDAGINVHEKIYPDHHLYQPGDFDFAGERPLIMTEKDAVKCRHFKLANAWHLPVDAILAEEFKRELLQKVDKVLQQNKAEETA